MIWSGGGYPLFFTVFRTIREGSLSSDECPVSIPSISSPPLPRTVERRIALLVSVIGYLCGEKKLVSKCVDWSHSPARQVSPGISRSQRSTNIIKQERDRLGALKRAPRFSEPCGDLRQQVAKRVCHSPDAQCSCTQTSLRLAYQAPGLLPQSICPGRPEHREKQNTKAPFKHDPTEKLVRTIRPQGCKLKSCLLECGCCSNSL